MNEISMFNGNLILRESHSHNYSRFICVSNIGMEFFHSIPIPFQTLPNALLLQPLCFRLKLSILTGLHSQYFLGLSIKIWKFASEMNCTLNWAALSVPVPIQTLPNALVSHRILKIWKFASEMNFPLKAAHLFGSQWGLHVCCLKQWNHSISYLVADSIKWIPNLRILLGLTMTVWLF